MKLPNGELAVVDLGKVADYLLNAAHPDNGGKARFFTALGFSTGEADQLAAALRAVALDGDVLTREQSAHGTKYVVVGSLLSPSGRRPMVRTVWIVDQGQEFPRLVTAYPHEE